MSTDYLKEFPIKVSIRKYFFKMPAMWNEPIDFDQFLKLYTIEERKVKIMDLNQAKCIGASSGILAPELALDFLAQQEYKIADELLFGKGIVQSFQAFLENYSAHQLASIAKKTIDAFNDLVRCKNLDDFADFRSRHPETKWENLVRQKLAQYNELKLFNDAKRDLKEQKRASSLEEFTIQFRGTELAVEAKGLLQEFNDYKNVETPIELDEFMHHYPKGLFFEEAKQRRLTFEILPDTKSGTLQKVEIFLSYARKDKTLKEELVKHLGKKDEKSILWQDMEILPGEKWATSIQEKIDASDIVIVLISVDFLYSKFCEEELQRAKEKGKLIIPIIIRPCDWESDAFISSLNVLPIAGKAVTSHSSRDKAFLQIKQEMNKVIERERLKKQAKDQSKN